MAILSTAAGAKDFAVLFGYMVFVVVLYRFFSTRTASDRIRQLSKRVPEMTPEQFMKMREDVYRNGEKAKKSKNGAGVYIIHNKTKRSYYVGQSIHILDRVNSHFSGKGNGDVYADYKYGDRFTIRLIPLRGSGYKNLNDLERNAIRSYNAYNRGYNKTRGNK